MSRRAHKRLTKRKIALRTVVSLTLVSLVAGGIFAYHTYRNLESNIATVPILENSPKPTVAPEFQGALNILVMGSDSREGESIGGETPGLSDTTILLHIARDRSFAYGVSLPRDAMVERPSCPRKNGDGEDPGGLTQFNQAYAVGGPACTVRTVEALTDVPIDHFAVVDFAGFRSVVDAVGGVEMCVPQAVNDTIGNIELPKGTYTMDGKQALDYVRLRHGIGGELGDIGRMKRQQAFIAALVEKVASSETLTNPNRLLAVLEAGTKTLTTDPEFANLGKLGSLAKDLQAVGPQNVAFVTVPFELWPQDLNRVQWTSDADVIWESMRTDQRLDDNLLKQAIAAQAPASAASPSAEPPTPAPVTPSATASPSATPTPGSELDKTTYGLC